MTEFELIRRIWGKLIPRHLGALSTDETINPQVANSKLPCLSPTYGGYGDIYHKILGPSRITG